jgi:small subunit ribosomal protein S17
MKKTEEVQPKRIRKQMVGIVTSTKMQKTITVKVESKYADPTFGKIIRKHKTYHAHCEDESVKEGDRVTIEEGEPKARHKSFYFVGKVTQK